MSGKSTKEKQDGLASPDPSFSSSTVPSSPRLITGTPPPYHSILLPSTMQVKSTEKKKVRFRPITPAPMIQDIPKPSYHYIPPPYPGQVEVHPHHCLEQNAVDWDIVDHPSLISRNNHSISSRALDEPAFDMLLHFITITSPYLPWTIEVRASKRSYCYITLDDMYHSIYRSLRTNITLNEFSTLMSESDQKGAIRAYEQRYNCKRQRGDRAYEEEKRGGMKRIDVLMGRTHFLGISNNGGRPDEWQLVVS